MNILQISKKDLYSFINTLLGQSTNIFGVVSKGSRFAFDKLTRAEELMLDYDETILPPKKFLLPTVETLLSFKPKEVASYKEVYDVTSQVIIGIHPADLAAIALTDRVFLDDKCDAHYQKRREASLLVGIYPTRPFKHRFSQAMLNGEAYQAADLMLIDLKKDAYAIEVVTTRGEDFLKPSKARPADQAVKDALPKLKQAVKEEVTLALAKNELAGFLTGKEKDPVFDARANQCFSCGSCVLVCPTCYCFDVQDKVELSLAEGKRVRVWDGCMLQEFAKVAGGHNFRNTAAGRLRHRIFRKGKYIIERFGLTGCVGCGRCADACTANIASPAEIINAMYKGGAQ